MPFLSYVRIYQALSWTIVFVFLQYYLIKSIDTNFKYVMKLPGFHTEAMNYYD